MIGRSLNAPQRRNHGDQRLPLYLCVEALGDSFMQPISWPECMTRCTLRALTFSSHNWFHSPVVSGSNGITVRLSEQSLASALVEPAVFDCAPILIVTLNLLNDRLGSYFLLSHYFWKISIPKWHGNNRLCINLFHCLWCRIKAFFSIIVMKVGLKYFSRNGSWKYRFHNTVARLWCENKTSIFDSRPWMCTSIS